MTFIKIDFSEEVSVDTMLMPVFDKKRECVGGVLFKKGNPEKKTYISIPEMIALVQQYTRLLDFVTKNPVPIVWSRYIRIYKLMLGDCILAYQVYEDKGMIGLEYKKTISREEFALEFGD